MKIYELKRNLKKDYKLLAFEDLADMRVQHRSIFDLFEKVKKDYFDVNERILLYSCLDPEHELLHHIQRAAFNLDISNFFILIICPFSLTEKLRTVYNEIQNTDTMPIQSAIYDLTNTKPFKKSQYVVSKTLCPYPFYSLQVNSDNAIAPCCLYKERVSDISNSSLQQEFYNDKLTLLREQLKAGKKPAGCATCWKQETAGTTSYRQLALIDKEAKLDHEWIDDIQLRDVSWGPGTLCNLKCRICSVKHSTTIIAEELKFTDIKDVSRQNQLKNMIKLNLNRDYNHQMIDNILSLPYISNVHMGGGEPFLWPLLPEFITKLIESNKSKNIEFSCNTNCSIYPQDILTKLITEFKSVNIRLSFDNVAEKFEIERGSKWKVILNNIKKFAALKSDKVSVKLSVTVNLQNVLYLEDIISFANFMQLEIIWWYVENEPAVLCIDHATSEVIDVIEQKYKNHDVDELRRIAKRMKSSKRSDGTDFLEYVNKFDLRREQKFSDTHREIYELMGGKL